VSSVWPPVTRGPTAPWPPPRGRLRADLIYLGWQPVPAVAEPVPPLRLKASAELDGVSADWMAAQRREYRRLSRPSRVGAAASVAVAGGITAAWLTGVVVGAFVPPGALAAACVAAWCAHASWRQRRVLGEQLRAEELRVAAFADAQRNQLAATAARRAREASVWKQRSTAMRLQPRWYPVTMPTTVHRIDIAGGTLAGWSAVLTMIAAPRLAAGAEVTVLDLTEGGVATDLLAVARGGGVAPLVWVLPGDLPQLDLGTQLAPDILADVLAQTVNAADGPAGPGAAVRADPAGDAALIAGVFQALGGNATMPQLIAALRALGQIGGPAEHLGRGGLAHNQLASLTNLAGRAAGHLAAERAWAIEARLRALAALGTSAVSVPASPLTVAWLDRRAAVVTNAAIRAYLAIALTAALRQAPAGTFWQRTICLLGAERLPGGVLDRLCDAAEVAGAGLVLCYRSIPPHVRERLGRGDAAVGFMRLGNADDARFAAEHIGTEHRFVVSQLTDTVGSSVTDTLGMSYTSTVGTADSVTGSDSVTQTAGRSRGRRTGAVGPSPIADVSGSASLDTSASAAVCDSRSITAGISTGTSWGWTTSRAIGGTDSAGMTMQRSRESLVEQHELQQLPQSAVLLCYPGPGGREVRLADANPAIIGLPNATLAARPPLRAVWPS
jgi:hypothetical protein